MSEVVSAAVMDAAVGALESSCKVLVVDDSSVARKQVVRCLQNLGIDVVARSDGRQALKYLNTLVAEGKKPSEEFIMMISDIEMPEMDGYTLTAEVRQDPAMQDLHVLLHTSLSGVFNETMVKRVGANDFLAKFQADELARRVIERVRITDDN